MNQGVGGVTACLDSKSESVDRQIVKLATYVNICGQIASLSHDEKVKVGSIIITDDFREVCAVGYNGNYSGGPNERDSLEHGMSGFIHAECNTLLHLGRPFELRKNLLMICTHFPCTMCAKMICNAGINRVVYVNDYYNDSEKTLDVFFPRVKCVKFDCLTGRTISKLLKTPTI